MAFLWEFLKVAIPPAVTAYVGAWLAVTAERRKLDARLEKLDQIEIEVQRVTRAQEEIKTELQAREWNRQWLMDRKREAYATIIAALAEGWYDIDVIARLWDRREDAAVSRYVTEHFDSFRDMTRRAMRTVVPELVFVNDTTKAIVDRVLRRGFEPTIEPSREYLEEWTRTLNVAKDEVSLQADIELQRNSLTK